MTLLVTKGVLRLIRMLGRGGGSAFPGLIAERLTPDIASVLARTLPAGTVIVTGTNGKTTTNKMLARIMEAAGRQVVANRSGSNLMRGIVSTLIERADMSGRLPGDLGLFEVDEAAMPGVAGALRPRVVAVLNLFRDQLDRYGELDTTARLIGQALAGLDAEVYLNADDPLVASLAEYVRDPERVHYFGVQAEVSAKLASDHAADSDHCPRCGLALDYDHVFFGHIGHYRCPTGHFVRPEPATALVSLLAPPATGTRFLATTPSGEIEVALPLPGLYNAYNALAALAMAGELGVAPETARDALAQVDAAFGRVELVSLDGRQVYLLLIKNPTGFNQVIQTFLTEGEAKRVLIAINDNFADGRDVSWLWDVGFEDMAGRGHDILASGIRGHDLALRLKYAEMNVEVEPDLRAALDRLLSGTPPGETAYVLPTYTAMLALRDLLRGRATLRGFWE